MTKKMLLLGSVTAAVMLASPAVAASKNYSYDALGRLIGSASDAGPVVTINYDLAGNRTNYSVSGASGSNTAPYRAASTRPSSSGVKTSTATYQSPTYTPVIAPALSGDHGLKPYAGD